MKFLAILAVLAMAFAVFAVLTDTETNDAADATVEPAPGTYYISPGTSANPNVRGITTAGDVAALTAGAYVTTASSAGRPFCQDRLSAEGAQRPQETLEYGQ